MPPSRPPCSFSPSRRVSPFSNHTNSTQSCGEGWMGLFLKVARSLNSKMAVFSLFFLFSISFILPVRRLRKYRNVYACLTDKPQCSYLLVYYYPCVSQFLTTQKEGENGMSLIFSMFEPNVFAMWSALLETTVIMAFDASLMNI